MHHVALHESLTCKQTTKSLQPDASDSDLIKEIWKHQTCILDELDVYTLKWH